MDVYSISIYIMDHEMIQPQHQCLSLLQSHTSLSEKPKKTFWHHTQIKENNLIAIEGEQSQKSKTARTDLTARVTKWKSKQSHLSPKAPPQLLPLLPFQAPLLRLRRLAQTRRAPPVKTIVLTTVVTMAREAMNGIDMMIGTGRGAGETIDQEMIVECTVMMPSGVPVVAAIVESCYLFC